MAVENNQKLNELLSKFNEDPSKLVSSFVRILNSTDSAYQKLNSKHRQLRAENKHLKHDKELLVKSEKMASINQFSMGIAHEINNPIAFIISNLNTLNKYLSLLDQRTIKTGNPDKPETTVRELLKHQDDSDYLEDIYEDLGNLIEESLEGANRIKNIVKELMLLKDNNVENTQYTNVHTLLDSCVSLVQRQIEHKVIIKKNYENLPVIKCYPNKMKQVFLNLLMNSADAISKKGIISIVTRHSNSQIHISITDTGCGIKSTYLTKIFDPFFTTKEVGQGMGLGLSTVYSIIKLHNGNIDVQSKPKSGTTFTISLPVGKNDLDSIHQKILEV